MPPVVSLAAYTYSSGLRAPALIAFGQIFSAAESRRTIVRNTAALPAYSPVLRPLALLVKLGALLAIVTISPQLSIDLRLISGVIILQTLPAVAIGLFTRWFHARALIAGWVVGTSAARRSR